MVLLCACKSDRKPEQETGSQNSFKTKDEALNNAIKSLPELINAGQKKMYGISDADIKSLTKGNETPLKYIDFESIMKSRDSVLSKLIPTEEQTAVYSLTANGTPKLTVMLAKNKNEWQIQSIGNKKIVDLYTASQLPAGSAILDINGMGITLIQTSDSSGTVYKPLMDYREANLMKDKTYDDIAVMKNLKQYGEVLRKQFGDKLNKGEVDY